MFADEEQSQLREEQSHLRRGHEKQDQIPDEEESSGAVSWLLTRFKSDQKILCVGCDNLII